MCSLSISLFVPSGEFVDLDYREGAPFCFIFYITPPEAQEAVRRLHNQQFQQATLTAHLADDRGRQPQSSRASCTVFVGKLPASATK